MRPGVIFPALIVVLVITMFSLLPAQQTADPVDASLQKWEYRLVALGDLTSEAEGDAEEIAAVEDKFNELGREGWELSANLFRAVVFRRPIQ